MRCPVFQLFKFTVVEAVGCTEVAGNPAHPADVGRTAARAGLFIDYTGQVAVGAEVYRVVDSPVAHVAVAHVPDNCFHRVRVFQRG